MSRICSCGPPRCQELYALLFFHPHPRSLLLLLVLSVVDDSSDEDVGPVTRTRDRRPSARVPSALAVRSNPFPPPPAFTPTRHLLPLFGLVRVESSSGVRCAHPGCSQLSFGLVPLAVEHTCCLARACPGPGPAVDPLHSELLAAGLSSTGRPLRGRERAEPPPPPPPPSGRQSRNSAGNRAAAPPAKKVRGPRLRAPLRGRAALRPDCGCCVAHSSGSPF